MTQMDKAKSIGISQGWLWKIYNGYATPGKESAKRLEKLTGKDRLFWKSASLRQIQKTIDEIGE